MTLSVVRTPVMQTDIRPAEDAFLIPGPAGGIEAVLSYPACPAAVPAIAVVCHPHPLHGGSLHNKVAHTLARACNDLGAAALRFNFRGVGRSAGEHCGGAGERADLMAVIAHARLSHPGHAVWLAGFSFGAYIAMLAAHDAGAQRLITIAPPVHMCDFDAVSVPACPWLLIQGTADEVVPYAMVRRWAAQSYPAPEAVYMQGAGHYFHGRLNELRHVLGGHLAGDTNAARIAGRA